jgi:hypothetical protein
MADLDQEQLRAVLMNTKNRVVRTVLVYQGGLNSIGVRLADCFREAVRANAAALILVHNHPSTDPTPSEEDIRVTAEASQAGNLLGIDVVDHIIVAGRDYCSLREKGLYTPATRPSGQRWTSAARERRRPQRLYQVKEADARAIAEGIEAASKEKARIDHCQRIARLGGQATFAKYGREHFVELGKKGFAAAMESIGGLALYRHLAASYRAKYGREPRRILSREEYRARQRTRAAARDLYPSLDCEVCGEAAERHHTAGCDMPDANQYVTGLCRQHHLAEHRRQREAAWQARHGA